MMIPPRRLSSGAIQSNAAEFDGDLARLQKLNLCELDAAIDGRCDEASCVATRTTSSLTPSVPRPTFADAAPKLTGTLSNVGTTVVESMFIASVRVLSGVPVRRNNDESICAEARLPQRHSAIAITNLMPSTK
jgi:hypothetical protein